MSDTAVEAKDEIVHEELPGDAVPFIPDEIVTINPDGAKVAVHPSGQAAVLTFFLFGAKKIVNVNLSGEAAVAIRGELPASSTVITPEKPGIILPG